MTHSCPTKTTIDSNLALVGRVWAEGVRGWMLTPRTETIKKPKYYGEGFWEEQQSTGLPAALGLHKVLAIPDDAAALVALLRARVRPGPTQIAELQEAYRGDYEDADVCCGAGCSAFQLAGLPSTTFVWFGEGQSDGCVGSGTETLYLLKGQARNPRFQLLGSFVDGEGVEDEKPQLHLPRFLALRTRLRQTFSALAHVSDPVLLALLRVMGGGSDDQAVQRVAGYFAFTRLMPNHPERGGNGGQPTDAETKLGALEYRKASDVPVEAVDGAMDPYAAMYTLNFRGIDVWDYEAGDESGTPSRLRPAMNKMVAQLEAFHRSR